MRARVPDSTIVNVVGKNADGWYLVRKPHWPGETTMAVPVVPPGAPMPFPRNQVRMLFEDSNPQLPFLYWPWARRRRLAKTAVSPLVARWACEQADFARSNAQLGFPIDPSALTTATAPSGDRFDRFLEDFRVRVKDDRIEIPSTPGELSPITSWMFNSAEAETAIDMAGLQSVYDTYAEDDSTYTDENNYYTVNHVLTGIDSAYAVSTSIVGDQIYLELEASAEVSTTIIEVVDGETTYSDAYTESTDPVRVLIVFSADPGGAPSIPIQWSLNLSETLSGPRDTYSDIVVTGGRVALLCEGPYLHHCSAVDGGDLQEVDLTTVYDCEENSLDTLAPCIGATWVSLYASGDNGKVYTGGQGTPLFCADLATNALTWLRNPADDHIYLHPLGFEGGKLICACEKLLYETVTNHVLGLTWSPVLYDEETTQLQGGLSHLAGICALDPATGSEAWFFQFPGEIPNGDRLDPFTDYYHPLNQITWTTFPNDIDEPNYYGTGFYPPYTTGSGLWHLPADLTDFYIGELTAEYQESNLTGTYIEGPKDGGADAGDFYGLDSYHSRQLESASASYQQPDIDNTYNAQVIDLDGGLNEMRNRAVSIEQTHRQGAKDYLRASVLRHSCSTNFLLTRNAVTDPPELGYEPVRSEPFTWTTVHRSQIEKTGVAPATPTIKTRKYDDGIAYSGYSFLRVWTPDYAYPPPGDNHATDGYSDQFRAWQDSRTSESEPPNPWEGIDHGIGANNTAGGDEYRTDEILIWRSVSTTPRTKTPAPNLTLGPCTSTGSALILGPRFVTDAPPEWLAVHNGEQLWTATIPTRPSAFPGPPMAIDLTGGGTGIWTGYQVGTTHYLSVLSMTDGAVLHEEEVPEYLREAIFGDGAIWKQQSRTFGITN